MGPTVIIHGSNLNQNLVKGYKQTKWICEDSKMNIFHLEMIGAPTGETRLNKSNWTSCEGIFFTHQIWASRWCYAQICASRWLQI